ncbi:MAG: hypothetical protein U0X73_12770 [Thermoanaerobaculia bacterium]
MPDSLATERERALAAKRRWHEEQARLPLVEKFRILLELQREDYPLLAARGALEPWEKPWDVTP